MTTTTNRPSPFGRRLLRLRTARKLSRLEVYRMCGMSPETLRNVESGKTRTLTSANLERLAGCYGTTVAALSKNTPTTARAHSARDSRRDGV